MAIPPPPAGWNRNLVKSAFGAGRDFNVLDPTTEAQSGTPTPSMFARRSTRDWPWRCWGLLTAGENGTSRAA